tara:strand:- start:480 stop:761 length:282 start_codon:yes stop_codon:yes gene_type:complete
MFRFISMTLMLFIPLCYFLLALLVAKIGKKRIIGYYPSLIISILLSPIVGLIITILYPKKDIVTKGQLKTCPDCAEEVMQDARKCKHCGYRWS